MRHQKNTVKLGRTSAHREALLAGLVCNLIDKRRIKTTLPKARAARRLAERMVTLGKRGTLAARRQAINRLKRKEMVGRLFEEIAPAFNERHGGYTRIVKLGRRSSDSSEMVIMEWVDYTPPKPSHKAREKKARAAEEPEEKPKAETKKKSDAKKK